MFFFFFSSAIAFLLLLIFFYLAKGVPWDFKSSSTFECGFSSYFFSRFSFSMHYYMIAMIFLFLDLELCFLMPFFNEDFGSIKLIFLSWLFVLILVLGILQEWKEKKLEWKF